MVGDMTEAKVKKSGFEIPSLNGIRAIAVGIVFIGHGATIGGPWPGDVGVTIFFFLSGYLITTLLRREYDKTQRISLVKFYLRRSIRILPPAYISIALCLLVGAVALDGAGVTIGGVLAELFNVTNYYMIVQYATTGDAHTGLPHESSMLWSLAVEEHFYLIFPALMILLLWRRLSYRAIGWILISACLLAPLWRTYLFLEGADFYRLYVASDVRFDGLLAGAAMALLANPALSDSSPLRRRRILYAASSIAALVFVTVVLAPHEFNVTIGDTVLYVCLVPLFWLVITRPGGVVGRILNNRIVAHIGVLSFSIYLLHRLVIWTVSEYVDVPPAIDLLSLIATVALAQIMYMFVEKPLAGLRKRLEGGVRHRPTPPSFTTIPNQLRQGISKGSRNEARKRANPKR
jgi:peptidoglycan/LPS O-acetylase OafA/YrhL